ncbi:MAG TPA: ACT domain-containing protein, partial [Peptostreptococcaceae bacterium]|nr:ACT domain-containing protein [Peptostreptococcaceae bacterium]
INFFVDEKAFVIEHDKFKSLEKILAKYDVEYEALENCAKVTLIGAKITGIPGVMAKVVRALSKGNVALLQTSDSSMTISCLVKEEDMINSIHLLHQGFGL